MQDKPTRVKVLVFTVVSLLMATTAFAQCMAPREQRGDGFAKSHKYDQAISDYANALTCPELTTADKTRLNKKIQNCKALKEKERKEKDPQEDRGALSARKASRKDGHCGIFSFRKLFGGVAVRLVKIGKLDPFSRAV